MGQQNMIPIIMGPTFEKIAEIDDYISFIWTTRYYAPGDFELCAPISRIEELQPHNYVKRPNDNCPCIIEKIEIKRTDEGQEMVIATGRSLESILERRVIANQQQITGSVISSISSLLGYNAISPTDNARKLPNFYSGNTSESTATVDAQYLGQNLLETISNLCETFSIGMKCTNDSGSDIWFETFDGKDRSIDQSTNARVIFSDDYDNLINCDYVKTIEGYCTDVLVGGEGEGTSRTLVWSAKDSMTGLSRYEKFLDASSAVSNDHIITQETYEKQLEGLGLAELTEYTTAFSGEVNFDSVNFGIDVQIGDIVTIQNRKWGMYINTRILEVIESVGEDGAYSIIPTFGT